MRSLLLAASLGGLAVVVGPSLVFADAPSGWAVLPVRASDPPPGDPTLLRLTRSLASAIHEQTDADVRVVSRDERDERCPDEQGVCPREIASMLDAERVVSFALANSYGSIAVRIYHADAGLEREAELSCEWEEGNVSCDSDGLKKLLVPGAQPGALDPAAVEAALRRASSRIEGCRSAKASAEDDPAGDATLDSEAFVSFRVRPDGRVIDVRIDPRDLAGTPMFRCVARVVEALELDPFSGAKPVAFRFPVLEPAPAEPTKPAKPTKAVKPKKPATAAGSASKPSPS